MSALLAVVTPRPALPPLYPHQLDGMARMRATIAAGTKSLMLAAPTGAGKTRIGAEVIDGALPLLDEARAALPRVSGRTVVAGELVADGQPLPALLGAGAQLAAYCST